MQGGTGGRGGKRGGRNWWGVPFHFDPMLCPPSDRLFDRGQMGGPTCTRRTAVTTLLRPPAPPGGAGTPPPPPPPPPTTPPLLPACLDCRSLCTTMATGTCQQAAAGARDHAGQVTRVTWFLVLAGTRAVLRAIHILADVPAGSFGHTKGWAARAELRNPADTAAEFLNSVQSVTGLIAQSDVRDGSYATRDVTRPRRLNPAH
jgi:hypothetical protein